MQHMIKVQDLSFLNHCSAGSDKGKKEIPRSREFPIKQPDYLETIWTRGTSVWVLQAAIF